MTSRDTKKKNQSDFKCHKALRDARRQWVNFQNMEEKNNFEFYFVFYNYC